MLVWYLFIVYSQPNKKSGLPHKEVGRFLIPPQCKSSLVPFSIFFLSLMLLISSQIARKWAIWLLLIMLNFASDKA